MRVVFNKNAKLAERKKDLKRVTEFYTEERGYTISPYLVKDGHVISDELENECVMAADFAVFFLYKHVLIKR